MPAAAVTGIAAVATQDDPLFILAGGACATALLWVGWTLLRGMRTARTLLHPRSGSRVLAAIREQRPHALEADPTLVHLEYAADVDERGDIVVWEFLPVPLGVSAQELPPGWQFVPGRPNHIAVVSRRATIDRASTVDSAEAVVKWQEWAAQAERAAAATACRQAEEAQAAVDELDAVSPEVLRALIPGRSDATVRPGT